MTSTNFVAYLLVAVCLYSGSSALFFDNIGIGGSSTASANTSDGTAGLVSMPTISTGAGSAIGGAGNAEMNMSLAFKSRAAAEFLNTMQNMFGGVKNLLTSISNDAGLASSSALNLFINPLISFFDLFQNVTFTSADHILSVFNQGTADLQSALTNGWKLFYDALTRGNAAVAGMLLGLLAGLQALFTMGNGLSFALNMSSGVSGGMGGGTGGAL